LSLGHWAWAWALSQIENLFFVFLLGESNFLERRKKNKTVSKTPAIALP